MSALPEAPGVGADNPIEDDEQDDLGRGTFADVVATSVSSIDATEGAVVALFGRWGLGKTSLINLVRGRLGDDITVLDFNPWMFSGAEQLVSAFFSEVGAQLRTHGGERVERLAEQLEVYGGVLTAFRFLPVIGNSVASSGTFGQAVGRYLKKRHALGSVADQRARIHETLTGLGGRLVVVVDDVDRLTAQEIRDMFRLVRLTARFPNLVYLLAFDRHRVEAALDVDGPDGRAYLEKIVQMGFDVPAVPRSTLRRVLLERLNQGLEPITAGPFHEGAWVDLLEEVIVPVMATMRDVKRYAATAPAAVAAVGEHVALEDALALEAVRLFVPDAFSHLPSCVDALTTSRQQHASDSSREAKWKQQIRDFVDAGGEHSDVVAAACRRLFPESRRELGSSFFGGAHGGDSRRERRVAHGPVLRYYLDNTVTAEVAAASTAAGVFEALARGEEEAQRLLTPLDADDLEASLEALEDYEDQFSPVMAEAATAVVMDSLPRLRTKKRGWLDMGAELVVTRVMLRILRDLTEADIERVVDALIQRDLPLVSKVELVDMVGHSENAGHQMVSTEAARRYQIAVAHQIVAAAPDELALERSPLRLIDWALDSTHVVRSQFEHALNDPALLAGVFRSALGQMQSWGLGSRAVHSEETLYWDSLVAVIGDEDKIASAADRLRAATTTDADLSSALELTQKYLNGFRPSRPGQGRGDSEPPSIGSDTHDS